MQEPFTFALPFSPLWLVVIGFILNVVLIYGKDRRMVLILSFASSAAFAFYNFTEVAFIGGFMSLLSIANTAYQASVADEHLEATKYKRLVIASLIGIFGAALMIKNQQDVLPLVAFLIVCYADTLSSKLKIIVIYLVSSYMWGAYALLYGDYWYAAANFVVIIFYGPRIWKLSREGKDEDATKNTHLKHPH